MAKTILIIGKLSNQNVQKFVTDEVTAFLEKPVSFFDMNNYVTNYVKAENGKITSDDVTNYDQELAYTNIRDNKRVAIIEDFELISIINQNKLLKTIEDNKDNTLQILIASNTNRVIKTIKSRVIIIDLRHEKLEYNCLDSELEFYKQTIKTQSELQIMQDDVELAKVIIQIDKQLQQKKYYQGYLLYTMQIKSNNTEVSAIVIRIIYNNLYHQKNYQLLKKLFEYEKRLSFQVNNKLQTEALFVEVIKEQKWNK